jgi:hypothetical protein
MRWLIAGVAVLTLGVWLSARDGLAPPRPGPPDARAILRLSDETMRAILTYRYTEQFASEQPGPAFFIFRDDRCVLEEGDEVHPKLRGVLFCSCEHPTSAFVPEFFERSLSGNAEVLGMPGGGKPISELQVEGTEILDGRSMWVLSYRYTSPGIEGPVPIRRREWIDSESFVLTRMDVQVDGAAGGSQAVTLRVFDADREPPSACQLPSVGR